MEDESAHFLFGRDLLDAFPFLAMVINEDYEVIIANTWLAKNLDEPSDSCPLKCYEARGVDEPRPDCPLAESIRLNTPIERELAVGVDYGLQVSIYPLQVSDPQGKRLFLDLAKPI